MCYTNFISLVIVECYTMIFITHPTPQDCFRCVNVKDQRTSVPQNKNMSFALYIILVRVDPFWNAANWGDCSQNGVCDRPVFAFKIFTSYIIVSFCTSSISSSTLTNHKLIIVRILIGDFPNNQITSLNSRILESVILM